jgi:sugar phosphate isomerase/epimerase
MKRPISVQLYSLRERAAQDFPAVLRDVAAMGYRGIEPAGLHGRTAAEARKMADDLGLVVSSAHVGLPTPQNAAELGDMAGTLGCNLLVSGAGPKEFQSLDAIKAVADRFNAAAALLKPRGLRLGYHNHWWEFNLVNGRFGYSWFFDLCPDVVSQLDVYWCCNFDRVDVPMVIKANRGRIASLHIKDGPLVQNEPHTAVGAGKMNIPAIVRAAGPATEWLVVELDSCATDMTQAVRDSLAYLVGNELGAGRA